VEISSNFYFYNLKIKNTMPILKKRRKKHISSYAKFVGNYIKNHKGPTKTLMRQAAAHWKRK
jgi:hypothetical protein